MLSPFPSHTAQTAVTAAVRAARGGFRVSSHQVGATRAGDDPSETGALGCG